ncbi:MAG TPA: tryptophan halogenase family protein [Caulobacteraceae bacterium]|nr:tryptophan halogenase family protein [Caulobacteraceae bacterium]
MAKPIQSILIVGGGTAGWFAGAYLARRFGAARPGGVRVTLIESADVPIVGVGEGTFPAIKKLILALGVEEGAFMRACSGAFKQGFLFLDWGRLPRNGARHRYYHPFNLPERTRSGLDLLPYWLMGVAGDAPLSEAIAVQDAVCEAGKGPRSLTERPFFGAMNYAYHFDAGRLAEWLAGVGEEHGVKRLIGKVESVELDQHGAIAGLITREHGRLEADLYIDCTGFRAELIGKALGSPYREAGSHLMVNRALAVQAPYGRADHPIATTTISTAKPAGWIWDIGLNSRRGVGYVYSAAHTTDETAEAVLRDYLGPEHAGLDLHRRLSFNLGFRERPWVKNCVAIGLSGGFLEPLESTGIAMIDMSLEMLAELLPRTSDTLDAAARAFGAVMTRRFEAAIDFLKLHYALSQRADSAFWTDNADPATWPESLKDKLEQWRERAPSPYDLPSTVDCFSLASWRFVLYGMGFETELAGASARYPHAAEARAEFARIRQLAARAAATLPDHRTLVEQVYGSAAADPAAA